MTTSDSHAAPSALAGRLDGNDIGVEGTKAIAAVLKDTKLSELGCAASRSPDPTQCVRPR